MDNTKFDLTLSSEELARQLLATSPEGDETYDKTPLRGLLYDPTICDQARYAVIFRIAGGLTDSHERKATFLLEVVNGFRRQPGLWDIKAAQAMLEQAKSLIDLLPDNPRHNRLLELWAYHAGLVYREAGEYEKAAGAQMESAGFAPYPAKAQISRFCAAVEMCHHGLVTGNAEDMKLYLNGLMAESAKLDEFRDNQDFTVQQWVLANAPAHRLYANYLAGEDYDECAADLQQMQNLPDPHRATYDSWTNALQALEAWCGGDMTNAAKFANAAMDSKLFLVATHLISLLILARIARGMKAKEMAAGIYKTIMSTPCHGGHFVRAIASRELATLSAGFTCSICGRSYPSRDEVSPSSDCCVRSAAED